jgi:PAS domain S-box-containing protein
MNPNLEELGLTLFEEAGDALFLFDPDSEQLVDVNPMAQRLTGHGRQDLLRLPVTYLFRSEVQGGVQRLRHAFRKTGLFHSQEGYFLRHQQDGVWVPVDVTVNRLHAQPRTLGLITARDISERRRALAELRHTEERLRTVIANAPVIIFALDAQGVITLSEGKGLASLGLGPSEVVGESAFDLYRDAPQIVRALHRALAGEELTVMLEVEAGPSAGRCFETHFRPVQGSGGAPAGAIGIATDVTQRRRVESLLAHERDLLHTLMDNIPDLIYFKDADSRYTRVNMAEVVHLGQTDPEQVLGKGDFDFYPADLAREFRADEQRIIETGRPMINKVEKQPEVDGRARWIMSTKVPIVSAEGLVAGIVGVSKDITERVRAEESLKASEGRYRSLIENLAQCVFLKDQELRFTAVNQRFCQGLGRPAEEIVGKTDFDFFPPHLAEKYRGDDRVVLTEGRRLELEEEHVKDGKNITVHVVKTPVRDAEGRIVGVQGIFWDITEQRSLEAQLRQAQKMEAVGQLAGGVAHDFNNLLTAILGNVSLLLTNSPQSDPNRALLETAEKATLRAAELTRQLLGFSRQTILRPKPSALNSAVKETVGIVQRTIDPRIAVVVKCALDLWTVQTDPGQINQVLMNLCLNARDAMPNGGRLVLETENVVLGPEYARLHLEGRSGEFVRLRVSDTGHGIPAEVKAHIFEPFFTTKGPGKGTGLGLAMVFGIVKQHRGWIDCYSEVNHGARFDVYLPRYHQEVEPAPALQRRVAGEGNETVLLVDDEATLRTLGATILQRYGYEVLLAEDGRQAVEVYQRDRDHIDLVILDLTMPRLSGRDAFREMRALDPNVRVLFASGYSAESLSETDNDQMLGFVSKPYRPEELAGLVRSALDRSRLADEMAELSPPI